MKNAASRVHKAVDKACSFDLRDLPTSVQRVVRISREIGFGRFENLVVKDSLPVFDPPPRVLRDVKLRSRDPQPPFSSREVKDHIVELIREFRLIGDGNVERLEIKHGLPFRIIVERVYESR